MPSKNIIWKKGGNLGVILSRRLIGSVGAQALFRRKGTKKGKYFKGVVGEFLEGGGVLTASRPGAYHLDVVAVTTGGKGLWNCWHACAQGGGRTGGGKSSGEFVRPSRGDGSVLFGKGTGEA